MRIAALLVYTLILPGALAAQEGVIKSLTPGDFEKIIVNDLKKDFAKKEIPGGIRYDIKDTDYYADYSSGGKFVMFFALADGRNVTLDKVNAWNKDAVFSRAYVVNNQVHFEVALSYAGGITPANIKDCYERTETEWKMFTEKVLKGNN
jgi:Putative bacterial sensory transduction regulator